MNPEENQLNGATPGVAPAANPMPETASPELDQLAADLASAAPEIAAAQETPVAPETPAVAPAEPVSSIEPPVAAGSVTLEPSSDLSAAGSPGIATVATPPAFDTSAPLPDPVAAPAPETPITPVTPAEEVPAPTPEGNGEVHADFTTNEETPNEDKTNYNDEETPITPANPVPGSIGSAIAYDENAPNNSTPVQKPQEEVEAQKKKIIKISAIAAGAVAAIALVVGLIMFLTRDKDDVTTSKPVVAPDYGTSELSSILCKRDMPSKDLEQYAVEDTDFNTVSPMLATEQFLATYDGEEFYDGAYAITVSYQDVSILEKAAKKAENVYKKALEEAGFKEDPFESRYNTDSSSESGDVVIYHTFSAEDLDEDNAVLVGIGTSKGEVASSLKNIRSTFRANDFDCTVSADE